MQPVWLCILSCRQFEDTFENTQWRKVKQMQSVWLCIFSGRQFEDTFENTQRRKVEQMRPICDYASSYASTLRRQLKTHDGENSQQMHQEKHYISSSANTLKIHWKALEEKVSEDKNMQDKSWKQIDKVQEEMRNNNTRTEREICYLKLH